MKEANYGRDLPASSDRFDHPIVWPGRIDYEFLGVDAPALLLIEASGRRAGIAPIETDRRRFQNGAMGELQEIAGDSAIPVVGGGGHTTKLKRRLAIVLIQMKTDAADGASVVERSEMMR